MSHQNIFKRHFDKQKNSQLGPYDAVSSEMLVAIADCLLADPEMRSVFERCGVYEKFTQSDLGVLYPLLDRFAAQIDDGNPAVVNLHASVALARRVAANVILDNAASKQTFIQDRQFVPREKRRFAHEEERYDPEYHTVPKVSDLIDILRGLTLNTDALSPYQTVKDHGCRGRNGDYFSKDEDSIHYGTMLYSAVLSEVTKHALFNRWQVPLEECVHTVDMWCNPYKPHLDRLDHPDILRHIATLCIRRGPIENDAGLADWPTPVRP